MCFSEKGVILWLVVAQLWPVAVCKKVQTHAGISHLTPSLSPHAQYEATFAAFVGAFSITGMLPVIPGPCGLFNMKHLNGKGVDFFFDKVKQDPDTAGLLLGNGLLAEDRFLTCEQAGGWRSGRGELQ